MNIKLNTAKCGFTKWTIREIFWKKEKKYLIHLFMNDINEIERLLQWDCSDWKNQSKEYE